MKREGTVLFCSDDNGFPQLKVALYSLLESAERDRKLSVYVFTAETPLAAGHVSELEAMAARYAFARLAIIDVTRSFARYRETFLNPEAKWGVMTWTRCLAAEVIDSADQIVYLDIDTFVCRPLSELYDLAMGKAVIAGVYEDARGDGRACYYWERLAQDPRHDRYFNAGALVLNLRVFREEGVLDTIADWYDAHRDMAERLDQDTLNALFWNRTIRLHPKYNYCDGWCERQLKYSRKAGHWRGNPPREVLESIVDPAIVHFWGPKKPWRWNCRPEGYRYERALRELGMLNGPLPGTTAFRRIEHLLFKIYHTVLRRVAAARI